MSAEYAHDCHRPIQAFRQDMRMGKMGQYKLVGRIRIRLPWAATSLSAGYAMGQFKLDSSPEPEPVPRYPFPAPPQPPNLSNEARGTAFWNTTRSAGTGYYLRPNPTEERIYRLVFADLQWHGAQIINNRLFAADTVPDDLGLPTHEQLQILENENQLLEQPVSAGPSYADAVNTLPLNHTEPTPADLPKTTEPPQTTIATPVVPATVSSVAPPAPPPTSAPVPPTPTPMATPTTSGGLRGLPPAIFTGDRSKSDQFLRDFRRFKILNRTNDIMPECNDWVDKQDRDLELVISSTDPTIHKKDTDEALWTIFEKGFKDVWKDRAKVQNTYDQLMKLKMTTHNVDSYIATFECLASTAEWEPDAKGTIAQFKSGLHADIHRRVMYREKWPTTMDEWKEMSRNEVERMREIRSTFGPRRPNPNQGQYQSSRSNNNQTQRTTPRNNGAVPMDVDGANISATITQPPRLTKLTDDERKKLAAEGRCFRCRLKGHMARECPQKNTQGSNAPRQNISAHVAEVEPATSEPTQSAPKPAEATAPIPQKLTKVQQLDAITATMTDEEYGAWLDSRDMGEDFYSAEL
ncbi:hypothetical protein EDB85DRAFT_2162508 [Lactarius pseudohatsudake]|nr:hypothetical protein EDB85DRAFT_2162508 [Lactarius pseudohatsudake]